VNIFVTLLAAYYILLYRYTYQDSIIIGLPLTNRRSDKFKEIMGCLMNIVPLRVDDIGGAVLMNW
jgi:hybrid polyketide synthase/nonribosomal peptide synthetase FtdB